MYFYFFVVPVGCFCLYADSGHFIRQHSIFFVIFFFRLVYLRAAVTSCLSVPEKLAALFAETLFFIFGKEAAGCLVDEDYFVCFGLSDQHGV